MLCVLSFRWEEKEEVIDMDTIVWSMDLNNKANGNVAIILNPEDEKNYQ